MCNGCTKVDRRRGVSNVTVCVCVRESEMISLLIAMAVTTELNEMLTSQGHMGQILVALKRAAQLNGSSRAEHVVCEHRGWR